MVKMSHRVAFAALAKDPSGQVVKFPSAYSAALPSNPTFIQHVGTISRTTVKFDTGNTFLGSKPVAITFAFRKIGNPLGVIRTGIRKASDDSFILIAEWPAEFSKHNANGIYTVTAEGGNTYAIVANDKFSIEYSGSATAGIEIAMNPQTANPTQTSTTQQYTGTYASAANALAATIKTRVLT
jgi:flagellin-like hook-associated protein FlgL